jgi:hypothetical protein
VFVSTPWPQITKRIVATGDSADGRGARGPVPMHVEYEARGVHLAAGESAQWQLTLRK